MIAALLLFAAAGSGQDDGADGFLKFGVGTRWLTGTRYTNDDNTWDSEETVVESRPGALTVEKRMLVPGKPAGARMSSVWTEKDGLIWTGTLPIHKPGSKAGSEWTYDLAGITMTVVHRGVEEVTVPAGRFPRAIRVQHRLPSGAVRLEAWLVPGTGVVKQVTEVNEKRSIIQELKEFTPAESPAKKDAAPVSDAEMDALFFKAKLQAAEVHLSSGRKEKAIDVLEELIKAYPKNPQVGDARRLLEKARQK